MKLPFSLGISSVMHIAVVAVSFALAVDAPVETETMEMAEVETRPVRFEVLVLPRPAPVEEALGEPEAPQAKPREALPVEPPAPRKKKPRKKKKKPPKKEPVPAEPEKRLAPIVVEKTTEPGPTTTEVTKENVAPKKVEATYASTRPTPANTTRKTTDAVGGVGTESTGSAPSGASLRGVRRGYLKGVYRLVDQRKSYPRAARRGRKQGRVILAVTIDAQGQILEVRMRKSSGHAILDKSAIETVRSLKKFPVPPHVLGWTRRTIKVPMSFKLRG